MVKWDFLRTPVCLWRMPMAGVPFHFIIATVAQMVEHWSENPGVAGSLPAGGTL